MSDTSTELNPGTGGSKMDESLVTQSDGITVVHRTRIAQASPTDGTKLVEVYDEDPGASPVSPPALGVALVNDARPTGYIDGELRSLSMTSDGRLRVASSPTSVYMDLFGDTGPIATDPEDIQLTPSDNPWGL